MARLTESEQAVLDLALTPLRSWVEEVKRQWRRQRARQREDLGLPPWEQEDD